MAASVTTDKAMADVLRLQQAPLPKAYRDALVPAAQALKEALEAEEAVGDSFIGEEAEKNLSDLPGISWCFGVLEKMGFRINCFFCGYQCSQECRKTERGLLYCYQGLLQY